MLRVVLACLMSLLSIAPVALAQRADTLGVDGIYRGTIGMQINSPSGKNLDYKAPAKLVFLPDGAVAILTAEHPEGVVSLVMKGKLRGTTFFAESKGLMDYGGYHQSMVWDLTFNPRNSTVVLHGKARNLPRWAKDDDMRYTFTREKKKGKAGK